MEEEMIIEHSPDVREGVAGAVLTMCGVDFHGSTIDPQSGLEVSDTRVNAIVRLAPNLLALKRLGNEEIHKLRSVGIEV